MPVSSIALLVVLGALLAGCGGDDGDGSSSATTPAAGAAVQGTGYALTPPGGWLDAGDEETGLSAAPDMILASSDPSAVVLVTIADQPDGVGADELLRTLRRGEVEREGVTGAGDAKPFEVAGAGGVTYHYDTTSEAGVPLRTRQVVVVRARKAYTIALTTPLTAFPAANGEFQSILESWRWAAATG